MNQSKTSSIIVAIVIVAIATIVFYVYRQGDSGGGDLWGYSVQKIQVGNRILRSQFQSEKEKLVVTRIRDLDDATAEHLVQERIFLFASLFERQRVGYKGQHTEFVECNKQFKPTLASREVSGGKLEFFLGYANDRFVPGACDEDSIFYRAVSAYLLCPAEHTLYDIEYFQSMEESNRIEEFLARISCTDDL